MRWIIEKVNEIRRKYGVDDLDFVAGELGAEVVEKSLGTIVKEAYFKDLGVIVIDPSLHPCKKRHLIAHGLAHHLFHRERRVNYFIQQKDFLKGFKLREQEREAEVFAAYLLIPEEELNKILKEEWVKEHPNPIPELAEEFQVSPHFMKKRLEFKELLDKSYMGVRNYG